MSSPIRRSLVLSVVLALLLGTIGVAAPVLGKKPVAQAPRVAGINVDAKTIPELQALMDRHRLSSVQLTQFYLHRIKKLNPCSMPSSRSARRPWPTLARLTRHAARAPTCRSLASLCSSRTTSTRRACRPPRGRGRSRAAARAMPSSSSSSRRRGGMISLRQPVRMGQLPLQPVFQRLERDG